MTEVIKQQSSGVHVRVQIGAGAVSVHRNSRCRFGQTRAPKRCIIEYKRGAHRARRSQRVESTDCHSEVTTGEICEEISEDKCDSGDTVAPRLSRHVDTSPPLSPNSETLSLSGQSSVLSEHKRPRPELQVDSGQTVSALSSSAPASCMRGSPAPLFGRHRGLSASDRPKDFECKPSLIDEERLRYLLSKEPSYHPNNAFLYYVNPETEDKVDAALRNEAVHSLRFMHNAFFNLSTETFCKAVNLIDRFIVKVKVKPKYMACVATASYCAASKLSYSHKQVIDLPAPETLVHFTRCGGNAADLLRMEEILSSKLAHDLNGVNAYDFLRLFADTIAETDTNTIHSSSGSSLDETLCIDGSSDNYCGLVPHTLIDSTNAKGGHRSCSVKAQRTQLIKRIMTRLEIALCSLEVYRFRPACLALGILAQTGVSGLVPLASVCEVDLADVLNCANLVEELYEVYYRDPLPWSRRPLVWTLSKRTLFRIGYSSPTPLDTIKEDCEPTDEDEWLLPLLFEP
ncbi:cyclin G2 [Paragonimus westermani]|uniref:Cyclin G2 n=1 Tax=Paragonimus westermani TaxID=34504 RepID=A0A5J4P2N5_9TREM|nr:cyclin G2 [Paragonimus westermani]